MNAINFSNRTRKRIKVRKVIVHENFTTSGNDIALLQLGKKNLPFLTKVCPSQMSGLTCQFSVLCVFLATVQTLLARLHLSMVRSIDHLEWFPQYYIPTCLRLGRNWKRYGYGQASRDCGFHCWEQQLRWTSRQYFWHRHDYMRRWHWNRTVQGTLCIQCNVTKI